MLTTGNMGFMLTCVAVVELCSMVSVVQAAKGSGRAAGDFSLDPLEFCENPETKSFMLEAEITSARPRPDVYSAAGPVAAEARETGRGAAAAGTWIVRGLVAAPPRLRRG